jgi:hypothetical protein
MTGKKLMKGLENFGKDRISQAKGDPANGTLQLSRTLQLSWTWMALKEETLFTMNLLQGQYSVMQGHLALESRCFPFRKHHVS